MEGRNLVGGYFALWVFGIAFGLIEAAVVVYLRQILGMDDGALFPLFQNVDEVQARAFQVEVYRELATLVLMLAPAYLFSTRWFERLLAYGMVFGLWDLAYYFFLSQFLDWPQSMLTYDVLFLVPTLWVAPVICPMAVSAAMVLFGTMYLVISRRRMPRNPSLMQVLMAVAGGVLIVWAFMDRAPYYLDGGLPPNFPWLYFAAGIFLWTVSAVYFLGQYMQQAKTKFF